VAYRTYTCPIARDCGGCELLAVPYPIQLRRKDAYVAELFGELAERDGAAIEPTRGMDEPAAYRHKAATPFAPGPHGRVRSGFYAAGTHRIVSAQSCLVEDERARPILNDVARIAGRLRIPAYREDAGTGVLRHAIVRCGFATDDILLVIVTNGRDVPHIRELARRLRQAHPDLTSIVQNVNTRRTNAMLGRENVTLAGSGVMHDKLLGCTFEIGPTSFYQTNPAQTEVLYQLAIEDAGLESGMHVLDAYCGTGTIGICAAAQAPGITVIGVEKGRDAVACARRNAKANGVNERCSFVEADATDYLAHAARREERPDAVILDPPRAGSTPAFLRAVAELAPDRVVYVSCNPETQIRDLEVLHADGYRLVRLAPVDMFPHTKHIETVALMSNSKAKRTAL
jgi:23S rRNA (uracil-5-)-methyltransferase RumA